MMMVPCLWLLMPMRNSRNCKNCCMCCCLAVALPSNIVGDIEGINQIVGNDGEEIHWSFPSISSAHFPLPSCHCFHHLAKPTQWKKSDNSSIQVCWRITRNTQFPCISHFYKPKGLMKLSKQDIN